MARITVEDCMEVVENRFELSGLAGYLAKEISRGRKVNTPKQDNDKNTVMALREIAEGKISIAHLRALYMRSLQKNAQETDDVPEAETENIAAEAKQLQPTDKSVPLEEETGETYISVHDYAFDEEDTSDEEDISDD